METIRIGTCVPGQATEKLLPHFVRAGFECVALNFHMEFPEKDLPTYWEKVRPLLEGSPVKVSSIGFYCNALENEGQRKTLEHFIDNAHLFGTDVVTTFAGALEGQPVETAIPRYKEVFGELARRAEAKGLQVNRNKCHVIDLDKPFRFCKAKFQILPSGRIITHGCRDGMKRARRKMRYFRKQVDAGEKTVEQVAEWLKGPIAYYEQFNDHGRVLKLRRLYYALFIKGRKTEEVKPCIGS